MGVFTGIEYIIQKRISFSISYKFKAETTEIISQKLKTLMGFMEL